MRRKYRGASKLASGECSLRPMEVQNPVLAHCMVCNPQKPGFGRVAWAAILKNPVLGALHGLQSSKTRFWTYCLVCNPQKRGFGRIAWSAILKNPVLDALHGLQSSKMRFWAHCMGCNPQKPGFGRVAWTGNSSSPLPDFNPLRNGYEGRRSRAERGCRGGW